MRINICILIITAAISLACCQGVPLVASTINAQDLIIPFNDLLPPLFDNDTTTLTSTTTIAPTPATKLESTTAKTIATTVDIIGTSTTKKPITTHPPPVLFKSTKKSYYQQQTEHIKELHLIDDDPFIPHDYSEQAEHLQHLHDAQNRDYQQQSVQQKFQKLQKEQSLKLQKQQKLSKSNTPLNATPRLSQSFASQPKKANSLNADPTHTNIHLEKHAKLQNIANQVSETYSVQVEHGQPLTKQQHEIDEYHPQQQYRQQHRFRVSGQQLDFNALQQYFDFQHTTHRPPKAGLPTLTPFPRHLK